MNSVVRFVCAALVAAAGCGDSGGGSASSGVDGSKLLTALTTADAQALCRFQRDGYTGQLPGETAYCTFFSNDADSTSKCEEWRDQCIASDDYEEEVNDDWECDSATIENLFNDGMDGCEGTVKEYEDCVGASNAARIAAMKRASCDNVPVDDEEQDVPEACKTLLDKCPTIDID